jgi:hypothetical protein
MLPLVELAMPLYPAESARRAVRRWAVVAPLVVLLIVALTGAGLAVDRFDEDRPAPAHLMYVLDADTGTALWASEDDAPDEWIARYLTDRRTGSVTMPLPYRTDPKWTGRAQAVPLEAPELTVLGSRTDGNVDVLELRLRSRRDADVLTLHVDHPVQNATIDDDHPPVTSAPSYPEDARAEEWPYELRFYDPPSDGIRVTLRLPGEESPRVGLSDYTVGLEEIPGFVEPPPDVDRSTLHSSDLVIVGHTHEL